MYLFVNTRCKCSLQLLLNRLFIITINTQHAYAIELIIYFQANPNLFFVFFVSFEFIVDENLSRLSIN